jgi:hypothetical protein
MGRDVREILGSIDAMNHKITTLVILFFFYSGPEPRVAKRNRVFVTVDILAVLRNVVEILITSNEKQFKPPTNDNDMKHYCLYMSKFIPSFPDRISLSALSSRCSSPLFTLRNRNSLVNSEIIRCSQVLSRTTTIFVYGRQVISILSDNIDIISIDIT